MAFEEGVNMIWILLFALALIATMIGFYVFFRPNVEMGWLTSLVNSVKWLIIPTPAV